MEETLLIPAGESCSELVEKHSRFIAQCFSVSDEKEAKEILRQEFEERMALEQSLTNTTR